MLFTNINPEPGERAEFWKLVEENERDRGVDQMSCTFADQPGFWADVIRDPECPTCLWTQYHKGNHAESARFDIENGAAMRAFLGKHPGWIEKPQQRTRASKEHVGHEAQPFAQFHDGRGGRTQYRIVGELPNELSTAARVALLREFTREFEKKRMPFVAVMHAPDHNNDEHNWHFHLIYYDRPSARITEGQITKLKASGFNVDSVKAGMWDLSVTVHKHNRPNRLERPLRQKKVAQVGDRGWIAELRQSFADLTNAQLEREHVERRVDARSYHEMGIVADPQEHLGTRQAALEARGIATEVGTANEKKQARALQTAIDQAKTVAVTEAETAAAQWQKRSSAGYGVAEGSSIADEDVFKQCLITAADLEHTAASLRLDCDRAASRATRVGQINRQIVQALEAENDARDRREHTERLAMVRSADTYLVELGRVLTHERSLVAECEKEAQVYRRAAASIEDRLIAAASAPHLVTAPTVETAQNIRQAGGIVEDVQPVADPLVLWLTRVETDRPYIRLREGILEVPLLPPLPGVRDPRAQAGLATVYRLQEEQITRLADHVRDNALSLTPEIANGRLQYSLDGVDPIDAHAFRRYQRCERLVEAIDAALNPSADVRAQLSAVGRVMLQEPENEKPRGTPEPPSLALPQGPEMRREETLAIEMAAPTAKAPQSASAAKAHVPPPSPRRPPPERKVAPRLSPQLVDARDIARDLVKRRVPLTIASDNFVDKRALQAAKVATDQLEAVRREVDLIVCAQEQADRAFKRIAADLKNHHDDLRDLEGRITLADAAPSELRQLAKFHGSAPEFQRQMRRLRDGLQASVGAAANTRIGDGLPIPAATTPSRFSTVEFDDELRAEARRYAEGVEAKRRLATGGPVRAEKGGRRLIEEVKNAEAGSKPSDGATVHSDAARQAMLLAAARRGQGR